MNANEYLQAISISGLKEAAEENSFFTKGEPKVIEVSNEEKIVSTACRACIANCGVLAHVKNGRVVRLEGNPADPMSKGKMCAKGLSGISALYHPNRNKYPLIRVGKRGGGRFRRASWDEALGMIADKLMQVKRDFGAEYVFCSTGGGGNPEIWSIARFCNIFGTPNWFEPGCAQCYLPRVLAAAMMYGGSDNSIADSNCLEFYDEEHNPIQTLVLWGTDPSFSCPSSGGRMVNELRAKGVKTVVIDPRFTPDAAKATVWLPIRPGTDVALMLAWIRYILTNKLYDHDFVLKWTNLPYLVDPDTKEMIRACELGLAKDKADANGVDIFTVWDQKTSSAKALSYPYQDDLDIALFGSYEINGKTYKTGAQLLLERADEFTLEKAGEICQLDPAKIEEAIRLYTDNSPSGLCLGVATDQTPNSVQAAMAADTMDMLMGNMEKPGVPMQRFRTSGVLKVPNYPVPVAQKCLPEEQFKKRLGGQEFKGLSIWYAGHPGSVLDAILTGKPYQPKVWIDRSGNKLGVLAEAGRWKEAIDKLEFIVHMYMYPTSFSAYADVILPTEEWLETEMIVETCNTLVARKQVAHLWETKDETVIWSNLAKACAERGHEMCQKSFDKDFMGEDMAYWDSMEEFFDQLTPAVGMTWKELQEASPYEYMSQEEWKTYYVYLQEDPVTGLPKGFDTPSKKLEIYCERMIELGRSGQPFMPFPMDPASKDYDPLPYYLEPVESPIRNDETAKEFPLVMTNGRVPFYHHGTLRNIPRLREMYPAPELWISPEDAAKEAIETGSWVWIESKRGKIRAKALVTKG
ncbi:MAG: molybdopterin-dependent oxidoreductase, partial [Lachnospiraceae bacterium]|nr:molybdopterin-dependent oxidoreductase [Lachnospiraceae bacterium]